MYFSKYVAHKPSTDSVYKNNLHTLELKQNITKHLQITHAVYHHIKHAWKKVNTYIIHGTNNNYNNNNNNINGSMGMGEIIPLSGVDSALVLTNPGVQ